MVVTGIDKTEKGGRVTVEQFKEKAVGISGKPGVESLGQIGLINIPGPKISNDLRHRSQVFRPGK